MFNDSAINAEINVNLQTIYDQVYPNTFGWILIASGIFTLFFGVFGNVLVCISYYRFPTLKSITNAYIVNLAFADLIVLLVCTPTTVLGDITETWFLGLVMCKILNFLQVIIFILYNYLFSIRTGR